EPPASSRARRAKLPSHGLYASVPNLDHIRAKTFTTARNGHYRAQVGVPTLDAMNAIQKLSRAWAHRGGRDPALEFFMNAPEVELLPDELGEIESYEDDELISLEELKRELVYR